MDSKIIDHLTNKNYVKFTEDIKKELMIKAAKTLNTVRDDVKNKYFNFSKE